MGNGEKDIEAKENKRRNGKLSLYPLKFEEVVKDLLPVKSRDKDGNTVKQNKISIRQKGGGVSNDIT